ncbi:LysM peptidoglycan-binding domain-containing protein [Peribacillus sp. SCS-155]|uniref:LysM peptidoglycan-binding domain-containing protein n=1 Tax=Peribacillus sedimenti TaxID=3115297 RepID=UPI003906D1DE
MFKFLQLIIILFVTISIAPIKGEAASQLAIGAVKANGIKAYSQPKQGSAVVAVLQKGEEYPVLTTLAGDSADVVVHIVTAGESLSVISKRYNVPVNELQKANSLTSTKILVGQKLKIPQVYKIHSVVQEDTLSALAKKYGVSQSDITKLNRLSSSIIQIGRKLNIPDYYIQVQLLGGKNGWVKKSQLSQKTQSRIVMGWKFKGTAASYSAQLNHENLNVVSPRWYTLADSGNFVAISADTKYLETAHNNGKQVWPLIGNLFDPQLTDKVLRNAASRQKLVSALRDSLAATNSDGINVDFENIDPKNKQDYVNFITELKNAIQPYGMKVAVDVTRENGDPFWSGSLDRKKLGNIADYIIMMGYDEHWGNSPVAGSVASMPWVKEGLELLMKDVPSHKIVLAVPFYTREWVTDLDTKEVKSIDRTMPEVEKIISAKNLKKIWKPETGQYYVEYTVNKEKHQIWIEDQKSITLRMNQVKQYHLGGAAAWYIGSETPDIWDVYHFNE